MFELEMHPEENENSLTWTPNIETDFSIINQLGSPNNLDSEKSDENISVFQFAYRYRGSFRRLRQFKYYMLGVMLNRDNIEKSYFRVLFNYFRKGGKNPILEINWKTKKEFPRGGKRGIDLHNNIM